MSRWIEAKVLGQKAWTDSLFSLFISAPIEPFTAGQFTQLGLSMGETVLFRPYSFVNGPSDSVLEFYYTLLPNGHLTPLLADLKQGDRLLISRKASGRFTLEHLPSAKILWLFATGTGLGVFLSLLQTSLIWQQFAEIKLIHSVRHSLELTHHEIIDKLSHRYSTMFQYMPVVTREAHVGSFTERIPQLIKSHELETRAGAALTPLDSQVMLCGNPSMVKEVTEILLGRGLILHHVGKQGHITIESYWKEINKPRSDS